MSATDAPDTTAPTTLDSWFTQLASPAANRNDSGRGVHGIVGKQVSRIRTVRKITEELGYVQTGRILIIEAKRALSR